MLLTFSAYLVGALAGWASTRLGPRVLSVWPLVLRLQVVLSASVLGLFAAWRLSAPEDLLWPLLLEAAGVGTLLVALATRRSTSPGQATLDAWAAGANGGFWVTPLAGMFGGPAAVALATLADRAGALRNAVSTHLLRRDAPLPQRPSTSWVDQSPLLALGVGLLLHLASPAPSWSGSVLSTAGPLLAFTGAALFIGSVLHPHHRPVGAAPSGWRRWLFLVATRSVFFLPLTFVFWGTPLAIVALLFAAGAPAFNPPQLAVLYGYRSAVVTTAARWGWLFAPVGLGILLIW